MLKKAYLEITNVCNLSCSFCHKTKRRGAFMSVENFREAAGKLRPFVDYLYFHLMGEPLLHPRLAELFEISAEMGFKVIITTNGTLLGSRGDELLGAGALHKVSVSLHSFEAGDTGREGGFEEYLFSVFDFCAKAAERGVICVLRLWNIGGDESLNSDIIERMHAYFDRGGDTWTETYSGYRIKDKVFLEWGDRFEWPDEDGEYLGENITCYGLRDQVGVLVDGSVVPCCLDADGAVTLGNIFEQSLDEILSSERAVALKTSLQCRRVSEPLCQRCGYANQKKY